MKYIPPAVWAKTDRRPDCPEHKRYKVIATVFIDAINEEEAANLASSGLRVYREELTIKPEGSEA